jgi:hypothetical protein
MVKRKRVLELGLAFNELDCVLGESLDEVL